LGHNIISLYSGVAAGGEKGNPVHDKVMLLPNEARVFAAAELGWRRELSRPDHGGKVCSGIAEAIVREIAVLNESHCGCPFQWTEKAASAGLPGGKWVEWLVDGRKLER
jgi:hypothetical protein